MLPLPSRACLTQQAHFEFGHCHVKLNLSTNASLLNRRISPLSDRI